VSERKPQPTPRDVEAAISENATLEKVQRQRPRWEDYVSEGIIDSVPQPDENGQCRASVNGHGNVVKMLKMNEEANRLAAWHGDNRAESAMRRVRRDERVEAKARKTHRPHASIVVPEMPWKKKETRGG
jgi:hypothetical protein